MRPAIEPILELRDVSARYGSVRALKSVSLQVFPGEIVTIIGANAAGKSTALMSVCRITPIESGEIFYNGGSINETPAPDLPPLGLCQVPEGRRIFPRLTVGDNLEMGAYFRKDRHEIDKDMTRVYALFPELKDRRGQPGGTLSGGEQQMLAIGRALMSRPKLLLLDEPSLGLAPMVVERIFGIIDEINKKESVTILLVEQNANIALTVASRGYVLETGRITLEDDAQALLYNPLVRKAYLGED